MFEAVKQNLDTVGGFLEDLKVISKFLDQQKIINDRNENMSLQEWKFWPIKSQTRTLSESIDRVTKVYQSLSYAIGKYDQGMVRDDDRLLGMLVINLRVAVGGSLSELASVLGFLHYKFEKGESLYDPNDKFYRRDEVAAGRSGDESKSRRADRENTALHPEQVKNS